MDQSQRLQGMAHAWPRGITHLISQSTLLFSPCLQAEKKDERIQELEARMKALEVRA